MQHQDRGNIGRLFLDKNVLGVFLMTNIAIVTTDQFTSPVPYLSSNTSSNRCCLFYFQVTALLLITTDNGLEDGSFRI